MRKTIPLVAVLLLAIAAAIVMPGRSTDRSVEASSVDAMGNYRLVTQDGSLFSRSSLKGRPYITYFGYASCPDGCPAMLLRLAKLRQRIGLAPRQLPILFITVDPRHDTPDKLAAFTKALNQPIIALTGSEEVINRVIDNAGVFVDVREQLNGTSGIEHTNSAYLYNSAGAFWDSIAPADSEAAVLKKLRNATTEPAVGAGASSLGYRK